MNLPFRKKKSPAVPVTSSEIPPYYTTPARNERTGVAWLLAIATLLITIAIILGLFFLGRGVYRRIRDRNATTNAPAQTQNEKPAGESGSSNSGNQSGTSSSGSSNSGSPSQSSGQSSSGSTSNSGSSSSSSAGSSSPSSSSTSGTTSGGTVSPQAATTSIPNTGPGDTIAIFFAVSLAGYLIHRYLIAAKQ